MSLNPRYLYVIIWIDKNNKEFVQFSLDRDEILRHIKERPYKIFFLLEEKSFWDIDKIYLNYKMNKYQILRTMSAFYPENKPEDFIPEQLWFSDKLSYLNNRFQRQDKFTLRKNIPKLFFLVCIENGLTDIFVDEEPIINYSVDLFVDGEVTLKMQELEWIHCIQS